MNAKPKRRWFQFSLRTLFILFTVACVGFGWWVQYSREWIRQRHEWEGEHGGVDVGFESFISPNAPGGLWVFGERGVFIVVVERGEEQEARRLFPEAAVVGRNLIIHEPTSPGKTEFQLIDSRH